MASLYLPILILQIFCLYHAFKNDHENKWLLIIIFLPFLGSLLYAYLHFFTRNNIDHLTEGVKEIADSEYKVNKIEKKTKLTDTIANKTILGNEYLNKGKYKNAIDLFQSCLTGVNADDPQTLMNLVKAHYLSKDYEEAVEYGNRLDGNSLFKKSDEKIAYAWALHNLKKTAAAEKAFQEMNIRFSHYKHRKEYANFLIEFDRKNEAKQLLATLLNELEHMDKNERRQKNKIYKEIKQLFLSIKT